MERIGGRRPIARYRYRGGKHEFTKVDTPEYIHKIEDKFEHTEKPMPKKPIHPAKAMKTMGRKAY